MIDIKKLRENPEFYKKSSLAKKVRVDIDAIIKLDKENRKAIGKINEIRSQIKSGSKSKPTPEEIQRLKNIGNEIKELESKQKSAEEKLNSLILQIPNPAASDVKAGESEKDNDILSVHGKPTKFAFPIKDYMQIGSDLDLIDVDRAAKVSGSRFGYLKNEAAMLEFALVQYAWDLIVKKEKYIPVVPPVMISEKAMKAMGYLEHGGEDETYHFKEDGLYFVGTSEQSMGPYHMDEMLNEKSLPLRYTAFSTCFRREAGSYGKDTKGILRVHQFDKIEMFVYCKPEDSEKEHQKLLGIEQTLVDGLGLPYRIIRQCTADLGKPAAKTYDIETWLPSQNTYRETHSTSNTTDYQARRLNIRFKDSKTGKNDIVHALNGTAFAIGRIIIMIMENYQQKDGSVEIPKVLQKYMGIKKIINKK